MRPLCFVIPFVAVLARASRYRDVPHKVKENILDPPPGWVTNGPAPSNHLLQLKIALSQPHFPILIQHLWEVSDPDHERYGAYLSKKETEALMAPHPNVLNVVDAWLFSYGIKEEDLYRSSAQDWISFRIPIALAEEMLDTKYQVYAHSDSSESIVRTTKYSLPESLHKHIDFIQPTTIFIRMRPLKGTLHWSKQWSSNTSNGTVIGPAGNQVDASCNTMMTLSCFRQLYNAVEYKSSATNGNKIGVTSYYDQYANNEDLQKFYQLENPAANGSNYTFVSVNGGLNNQSRDTAGMEADMDTQLAFGLSYPTPAIFYSTGGYVNSTINGFDVEPYLDWINYVSSLEDIPQTVSNSYSWYEYTFPYNYATRVCDGFAALGVRGVTVVFSSGDAAVGDLDPDPETQKCFTNDGTNRTVFIPHFPATCPFVTTVGGVVDIPETAAYFSGGGFSYYFPRPSYQSTFVNKYLENLAPGTYKGLYNPNGRAIPDVSAQGSKIHVVYKGGEYKWSGTSASCPIFAALVSMLNDARINANKFPFGFINPWLYTRGRAGLNDITVGSNPGCGTQGFNATIGWDPVTGLGSPNFQKLLELAIGNHY